MAPGGGWKRPVWGNAGPRVTAAMLDAGPTQSLTQGSTRSLIPKGTWMTRSLCHCCCCCCCSALPAAATAALPAAAAATATAAAATATAATATALPARLLLL